MRIETRCRAERIRSHPGRSGFPVLLIAAILGSAGSAAAQARRLPVGEGAVLLAPDTTCGLVFWAERPARPGHRPAPDFVGWIAPDRIPRWVAEARLAVAAPVPEEGSLGESAPLVALDGGTIMVLRAPELGDSAALAFGHPREQQRWFLAGTPEEVRALLDAMLQLASGSRLAPAPGLGYANPTHRAPTPDRLPGPLPRLSGPPGEVWASAELDPAGRVVAGSVQVLWATRASLGDPVKAVLPSYRFQRHDRGRPERLRVYQRFRVR